MKSARFPLELPCYALNLERESTMALARGTAPVSKRPMDAIREHGMLSVPESFKITITARRPLDSAVQGYGENLRRALVGIGIHARIQIDSFMETSRRIAKRHRFEQEAVLVP